MIILKIIIISDYHWHKIKIVTKTAISDTTILKTQLKILTQVALASIQEDLRIKKI